MFHGPRFVDFGAALRWSERVIADLQAQGMIGCCCVYGEENGEVLAQRHAA
jgi:hypothetical protein